MADNIILQKLQTFLLRTKLKSEEQSEEIIRFAEERLPGFIRTHFDPNFDNIYAVTEREVYKDWRESVFEIPEVKRENESANDQYTETLKVLEDFYESSIYRGKQKAVLTEFEKGYKKPKTKNATKSNKPQPKPDPMLPQQDELEELTEGRIRQVNVTRHERNGKLRQLCLAHYGYVCQVCGMNFEQRYGEIGKDFIEVHHLNPIADTDGEHALDPEQGLVPLCSNCHSMIHRGGKDGKPITLQALKELYRTLNPKEND